MFPPDYEMPRGRRLMLTTNTNTYKVVVVASDDAPGAVVISNNEDARNKGYKKVTITVTDMPEPGIVTLSSLQPQVDGSCGPADGHSRRPRSG